MFKNQKGITLIALIITIIVLLILAGVTIAMLTGSDSAPAKANEASQKNDISTVKDQVFLNASNAQLEYYNDAYVVNGATGTGVSAENSKKGVGAYVAYVESTAYGTTQQIGNAKIKVVDKCDERGNDTFHTPDMSTAAKIAANVPDKAAFIRIETRDFFVLGYVEATGGAIKWSKIYDNGADVTETDFTAVNTGLASV